MKLAAVELPTTEGARTALVAEHIDGSLRELPYENLETLLRTEQWRDALDKIDLDVQPVIKPLPDDAPLFALPVSEPRKIICVGLNYGDHIEETKRETPEYPTLFGKFADCLTRHDTSILVEESAEIDWEGELALVIGQEVYKADTAEAKDAIAGYTIANDISMRDWQRRTLQWLQGKTWPASTPLGPFFVTADQFEIKPGTKLTTRVNGEIRQQGDISTLVFGPVELVQYISNFTPLSPGDIILTGTPGGVGMGMQPKQFLQHGDEVTVTIDGIDTLTTTIRTH